VQFVTPMSAIGPKRPPPVASHMSAFGVRAETASAAKDQQRWLGASDRSAHMDD
jgi:hypothetical protein